jgi:protein-S-isoprenylcysteine O-methyltransferase Ste14
MIHAKSDMNTEQTFRLLLIAGWLLLFPMMLYHRVRAHTPEKLDRRQEGLFILLTLRPVGLAALAGLVAYLVNPAFMAWASAPFPGWLRWAGVATLVAAGLLLVWTVHTLGPNLTDTVVTRRNHTLVTAGPYRWVRHPFYGAVASALIANALAAANWFLLAAGFAVVALLVRRTDAEEARLLSRFGDSYRTYMEHTGRFLPGIGVLRRRA